MKKYFIFGVVLIIILVISSLLLPVYVASKAESYLMGLGASNVQVSIRTVPSVRLLLGQMDTVDAEAKDIAVGKIVLSEAKVSGENVRFDPIAAYTKGAFDITSVRALTLTGRMTDEAFRKTLAEEYDKLENMEVEMHPEGIYVTADARLFKRAIRISMEGEVVEERDHVYLHVRRLDIQNASFGSAAIAGLIDDIPLIDLKKMPLRVAVREIEQADGYVQIVLDCENE